MTYEIITDIKDLKHVAADIREYGKLFNGSRYKLAVDKETQFTHERHREFLSQYETKMAIPQCYQTDNGNWEGIPRLIQIGLDPTKIDRQYVIDTQPIFDGEEYWLNKEFVKEYHENFKDILENEAIWIGQTAKYDLAFSALQFGIFPTKIRCTQLMAILRNNGDNLLQDNSEAEYRLDCLYDRYIPQSVFIQLTGKTAKEYHKFKKDNQTFDWAGQLGEEQYIYASDDVKLIFYVYKYLIDDIQAFCKKYPKSGLAKTINLEGEFTLETALMQSIGMGMNADYQKNELVSYLQVKAYEQEEKLVRQPECWLEYSKEFSPKKNPHTKSLCHFVFTDKDALLKRVPEVVTNGSGDNLAKVLTGLGFELPKTEKGKDSVAGETLRELYWKAEKGRARDILGMVNQYRKANSFLSKNGENQLKFIHSDGRVHPTYWQMAAETARLAATKPAVMTIPKQDKMFDDPLLDASGNPIKDEKGKIKTKDAFYLFGTAYEAREGYLIIDGDFSNEEVRVIGEKTGDKEIIRAFTAYDPVKKKVGLDLHQITADNLGVDRQTGKLFFLSSMYGAYEKTIMENLYDKSGGLIDLEYNVVKELRKKHFELYYGLKEAIDECARYVEKQLEPFDSLVEFRNRKPLLVGFTDVFGAHRLWCLNQKQERNAHRIVREGLNDFYHKNKKVQRKDKDGIPLFNEYGEPVMSTMRNEWNNTKSGIIREIFNYYIQAECSYILKTAVIDINRRFRAEGFDPLTEGVILTCHDEIATEVKEAHVDKAREIQEYCMLSALNLVLKKIPAEVSIGIGRNLYEASPK